VDERAYFRIAVERASMDVVPEAAVEGVEAVENVQLKLLAGGSEANVQHFTVAPGAVVPEHSHPHEQLGYVLSGALDFAVDGETVRVEAGDSYVIPGGEPHGAVNHDDEPAVGLDVFAPPRDDPDWRD
jgi:quercetin dioxygenase-like cupin family protein